jgi:hypothetical protein
MTTDSDWGLQMGPLFRVTGVTISPRMLLDYVVTLSSQVLFVQLL